LKEKKGVYLCSVILWRNDRNDFMALDYVFIAALGMGISGAAVATGLGYSVTAVVGLFVFSAKKKL